MFSGEGVPAGGYTESLPPDPVSVVGRTMLQAEARIAACPRHCIVRLALPLGDSLSGRQGRAGLDRKPFSDALPVTLFYDEYRSCIECRDLGPVFERILTRNLTGLYHLGGVRPWSLYEIGQHVLKRGRMPSELLFGRFRKDEKNGPPRIGNVALNSTKLAEALKSLK